MPAVNEQRLRQELYSGLILRWIKTYTVSVLKEEGE